MFLPYLTTAASDRETLQITSYANEESSVCNDNEESFKKYRGSMFCMGQIDHKDFKALNLQDDQSVKSSERLINFWFYSELTPMLEKQQQGVKP